MCVCTYVHILLVIIGLNCRKEYTRILCNIRTQQPFFDFQIFMLSCTLKLCYLLFFGGTHAYGSSRARNHIWARVVTYATAAAKAGSLTQGNQSGIERVPLQRQARSLTHCTAVGTPQVILKEVYAHSIIKHAKFPPIYFIKFLDISKRIILRKSS